MIERQVCYRERCVIERQMCYRETGVLQREVCYRETGVPGEGSRGGAGEGAVYCGATQLS